MKKTLLNILFLLVVFYVGDLTLGYISDCFERYTLQKRPEAPGVKIPYIVKSVDADVLVWGASTASHNYISQEIQDSLHLTTYNCGYDGTFIYFQTALLDLLLERYTPKLIIWETVPNCLSNTVPDKMEFLNIQKLYPYYHKNRACKNVIDMQDKYNWIKMRSSALSRNHLCQEYLHCHLTRSGYYPTGYAPIEYGGTPYPSKESSIEANDIVQTKEECLVNILKKLQSKGVKVVFTFCPIYREPQVLAGNSYKHFAELAQKYDAKIINSYNIEPFCNDSSYFRDPDHMFEKGAKKYMQYFIPELKKTLCEKK